MQKTKEQRDIANNVLNVLICAENDDEDAEPIDNFYNYVSKQDLAKFASALLKFNDMKDNFSNLCSVFSKL